ncbi:MAG: hypothetical protein CL520_02725 [Actinobacteria bacterium]|uniref:Prevent-host-death protein n=1 Tax=marine metagenome TaxID=408172 RepID=A0A381PEI0_9ZZZZ|nr:hypothetical protein [Actinomycetota bacterium]MEC8922278.1 hypothetical protein [Actinomycetota bacterium]MEC9316503.1 hypothetical protein [Actinomycetota bacterium]MED5541880.1 hypothetical protein [Actinomycetota bacterium]MEE3186935.1 hypothetical protein [Actinomycetota bacterium]
MTSNAVSHVGTRELRAHLASHLRTAAAGHTIFITLDGRVVAQLGPVGPSSESASIDALIATGLVIAPRKSDRKIEEMAVELPAGLSSDRALREIRGR